MNRFLKFESIVLIGILIYLGWGYLSLHKENKGLFQSISLLEESLENTREENARLQEDLDLARGNVEDFEDKVNDLTKLTQTDSELLKKYSKVYFLSENYTPRGLVNIDEEYLFQPDKPIQVLGRSYIYLQNLLIRAARDEMDLKVVSGYRSFDTQGDLKGTYKVVYGAGTANQFSAEQGYSEHQLGTALDFTTSALGDLSSAFSSTPEYQWLLDNAYKYGYILSYPQGNTYYVYEPWHWRFVGVELATRLHEEGNYFYDLTQRQLDQYLIKIFD